MYVLETVIKNLTFSNTGNMRATNKVRKVFNPNYATDDNEEPTASRKQHKLCVHAQNARIPIRGAPSVEWHLRHA